MYKSIFLFSLFVAFRSFGQTSKVKDSVYFKLDSSYVYQVDQKKFRIPPVSILQTTFVLDQSEYSSKPYHSLNPGKIYKKSSTIFDVAKILLLPDGKFFYYSHSCLSDGISAGSYTLINNVLTLKSSEKIYNQLAKNEFVKSKDCGFLNISSISYLIKNDELIYLKH